MPYLQGLVSCEQDVLCAGRMLLALIDDLIQPHCGSDQCPKCVSHRCVPLFSPPSHPPLTIPKGTDGLQLHVVICSTAPWCPFRMLTLLGVHVSGIKRATCPAKSGGTTGVCLVGW